MTYNRVKIYKSLDFEVFDALTGSYEVFDFSRRGVCHGKGSGGGGTTTVNNSTSPPPQVLAAYQTALDSAQSAASQPLQQYSGATIAGFTPDQTSAFNAIDSAQGIQTPYIDEAQTAMQAGQTPLWSNTQQFSPDAISQYQSPYTSSVLNTTVAAENNQDQQQQAALQGNAISSGAWGGDRAGVASAILSGQQDIANNATNANIENTGYNTALGEFNTEQQSQLGANEANSYLNEQAGFGEAGLGTEAQNTALTGANAQEASGAIQQQLGQAALNVPYDEFLQEQAYPFQTAQFFSNVAEGIGSESGGSGTSATTTPTPSTASQVAGFGLGGLGIAGLSGAFSKRGGRIGFRRGGFVPRRLASGGVSTGIPDLSVDFIPNTSPAIGKGPPAPISASSATKTNPASSMSDSQMLGLGKALKGISGMFGSSGAGTLENALDPDADALAGITNPLDMFDLAGNASEGAAGWAGADAGVDALADAGVDAGADAGAGDAVADLLGDAIFAFARGGNIGGFGRRRHYDGGGTVGGQTPTTAQSATTSPIAQTYQTQFQGMSPQQIQQVLMRLPPGSPQEQAAQTVLQQKRMMPNVGGQVQQPAAVQQNQQAQQQSQGGLARGGRAQRFAMGGAPMPNGQPGMMPRPMNGQPPQGGMMRPPMNGQQPQVMMRPPMSGQPPQGMPPQGMSPVGMPMGQKRGGRAFADGGNTGIYLDSPPPDVMAQNAADLGDLPGASPDGADVQRVKLSDLVPPGSAPKSVGAGPPQPLSPAAVSPPPSSAVTQNKGSLSANASSSDSSYASDEPPNSRTPAKPNPWLALAQAGFGAAAGTSPYAGVNIARGAEAGLQNYGAQQKEADSVNDAADKLMAEVKQHKDAIAVEQQRADEESRHNQIIEGQGKNVVVPGLLGSQIYNTGSKSWITPPDMGGSSTGLPTPPVGGAGQQGANGAPAPAMSAANIYKPPAGQDGKPLTGDAYLATVPPQIAGTAKSYLKGELPPPTGFALKNPAILASWSAAQNADPENADNLGVLYKMKQSMAPGGQTEKTVRSQNVAMEHIDTLNSAVSALDNGNVPRFNQAVQQLAKETGHAAPGNFDLGRAFVSDELAKAVLGSTGAAVDRDKIYSNLSLGSSNDQAHGFLDSAGHYMAGQAYGLETSYNANGGKSQYMPQYRDTYMSPRAQALIDKYYPQQAPDQNSRTEGKTVWHSGAGPMVWKTVNGKTGWVPVNGGQ